MATEKLTVVVPNEDDFKPAPIPFGVVSGPGVDNYDGDGKEYSVTIVLDKKMEKAYRKEVLAFWEENKPSWAGDEPANWKNIVRDGKVYAKTQTEFDGKHNEVPIVNHEGTKLDPEEFGSIGDGSMGRLAITLSIYTQGKKKAGVSTFLSAVKLTKFVPYSGGGGANAFGQEDGDVDAAGGFKGEKKDKKKDKKKNKKKK